MEKDAVKAGATELIVKRSAWRRLWLETSVLPQHQVKFRPSVGPVRHQPRPKSAGYCTRHHGQSNLPCDTNEHEIEDEFKKYGITYQDADDNKRIKMYKDEEGNFNGDCLIVYFKKGSVDLAIRKMNDYHLRVGDQSQGTLQVKEADFSSRSTRVATKSPRRWPLEIAHDIIALGRTNNALFRLSS
ncbi:hypothetical protein E8E13_010049 [Curvularia kusanoi]|uniref:RRM domain-containing protein n=1 Tax=Curvularia kusanoi TaxID=90978 RepID=A0A9P4THN5_CURKU|nr:hypothetical protein E8E13_010049 [Curvularia kusanoi]